MPILDDGHASYDGFSEVMDAIVEYGKTLIVNAYVHDASVSSVVICSRPYESPHDDYVFMVVPTESSSSESQSSLISSNRWFLVLLLLLVTIRGFDVCHSRYLIYLFFSSLGVMLRDLCITFAYCI